jgi:hypothetical protein
MKPLVLAACILVVVACLTDAIALRGRHHMPMPVTFSVSNASESHQVTLDQDRAHPLTVIAWIDGHEHHLDDSRARKDGKALMGGGLTIQVFQTTITVTQYGHVTFSGIITEDASKQIVAFVRGCRLPSI